MKEKLYFAHGNGFPAQCYSQLLKQLSIWYDCFYIDMIGHNPLFPVTENWHLLVNELLDDIQSKVKQPVIAVGHSLGGVLSFFAAIEQPHLFKAVIMIDSPLLGRFKSNMLKLAKIMKVIDRVTPALRTRSRREHWRTKDELITYLKSRDLFKTFTTKCLQDYIDYGCELTTTGYKLRFDRHIEYLIYRTIPHILHEYKGKLQVPAGLIFGEKSTVVTQRDAQYMRTHYNISSAQLPGTHMLPMEFPEEVANTINKLLNSMLQ